MRSALLLTFVAFSFCVGPLTNYAAIMQDQRERLRQSEIIFNNPHLKSFEKHYFMDPQEAARAPIAALNAEIFRARQNMQGAYGINPQMFDRNLFISQQVDDERKIGDLLKELTKNAEKKTDNIIQPPVVDPKAVAEVKNSEKQVEKAQESNNLRLPHAPAQRPSETNTASMDKLNEQINALEQKIQKNPVAPKPSEDEVSALNRLNEKMTEISEKIHQKPSDDLKAHLTAQGQMLSGLADLVKSMANAVNTERRNAFLQHVVTLLDKHDLLNRPYTTQLVKDIALAIASGNEVGDKYHGIPTEVLQKLQEPVQ